MPFNLRRKVNSGALLVGGDGCPEARIFTFQTLEQDKILVGSLERNRLHKQVPIELVAVVPIPVIGEVFDIGTTSLSRSAQRHCTALADCALAAQCPFRFSIQQMAVEATAAGISNMPASEFRE